jgi:predicted RNA-binding Zn ribbon-like protein
MGCIQYTISPMETLYEGSGELAIDLANTLELRRDGSTVDLLADQDGLARWLRHAGGPGSPGGSSGSGGPSDSGGSGGPGGTLGGDEVAAEQLQALRGHVLALLGAAVRQRPLPRAAVTAVNRAAAGAPAAVQLEAGELVVRYDASRGDAFLADVAASAISMVGGPRRDRLRRCGAPGCGRWFVASRPRQRWCSPNCGNRARVARFQQRHRAA